MMKMEFDRSISAAYSSRADEGKDVKKLEQKSVDLKEANKKIELLEMEIEKAKNTELLELKIEKNERGSLSRPWQV